MFLLQFFFISNVLMFFETKEFPSQFIFLVGTIFEHNYSCNEKLFEHFLRKFTFSSEAWISAVRKSNSETAEVAIKICFFKQRFFQFLINRQK